MLRLTLISLGIVVAAWVIVRLWRARGPVRRLADERLDEDGLRAGAEAILAARLARGEIDDGTYARTMQALWGLPAMVEMEEATPVLEEAAPIAEHAAPALEEAAPVLAEADPVVDDSPNLQPEPAAAAGAAMRPGPAAELQPARPAAELQGEVPLGDTPPEY